MEIKIGNIDFFFRESSAQGSATTEIPHTMVAHATGHVYGNARRQTHALIDGFFDKIGDNAGISLLISVDQKPGASTGEPSAATSNSASRPPPSPSGSGPEQDIPGGREGGPASDRHYKLLDAPAAMNAVEEDYYMISSCAEVSFHCKCHHLRLV